MKERIEIGIFKNFRSGERYKAERTDDRADP